MNLTKVEHTSLIKDFIPTDTSLNMPTLGLMLLKPCLFDLNSLLEIGWLCILSLLPSFYKKITKLMKV